MSARKRFPHPYKECFVPLSIQCGTLQPIPLRNPASLLTHRLVSTPLRGSASSLAHLPVSGSDTICNSPSLLLAYIVLFGFFFSGFPSRFLKHYLLGRGFHTLRKSDSFTSPINVGSHIPIKQNHLYDIYVILICKYVTEID